MAADRTEPPDRRPPASKLPLTAPLRIALAGIAVLALILALVSGAQSGSGSRAALQSNPELDPGTALGGRMAPNFTLTDQFGQKVSLASFRGKVVVLAFNDSQCLGVCPLTTAEMLRAQQLLGAAAGRVQLLGVDANPNATSVSDVRSYSALHGLTQHWLFLTGSLATLRGVWSAYGIESRVLHGQIDHTPAVYLIDPQGRLARVFLTPMAYAGSTQQAQILAEAISALLSGHPKVHSNLSYRRVPALGGERPVTLPSQAGPQVQLGASGSAHLLVFFATWDREVENLSGQLSALNGYAKSAAAAGLPPLTAIDEAPVEPSPGALTAFLAGLHPALSYPVAIDGKGKLADLYGVEEEPWFVLTSASGKVLWYYDAAASGWPDNAELIRQVRAALNQAPSPSEAAAHALSGSPPVLASLHEQAGALLPGGQSALSGRIKSLHGYPLVLNAWASWCTPCQQEFPLMARAALSYGRRVAFLGADAEDPPGAARSFLAGHALSYPSYSTSTAELVPIAVVNGLPDTVFFGPEGSLRHIHFGPYESQGSLDADIEAYALAGG